MSGSLTAETCLSLEDRVALRREELRREFMDIMMKRLATHNRVAAMVLSAFVVFSIAFYAATKV